jgi:hypothetical protein
MWSPVQEFPGGDITIADSWFRIGLPTPVHDVAQVLLALPLGFALRPKIPECPNRVCSCQVAKGVRGLATILTLHLAASTGQYPVA